MGAKSMHRLNRALTRAAFEKLFGGEWVANNADRNIRHNSHWETYTKNREKFARNLKTGAIRRGKTWREVADSLGIGKVI